MAARGYAVSGLTSRILDEKTMVFESLHAELTSLEFAMKNQQGLPAPGARQMRRGGVAVRVVVMLVVGAAIGSLIYFYTPKLFSRPSVAVSNHPQLKTGGTSAIFVVTENRWKARYAKEKGVDISCQSAGTTGGVTGMLDKTYMIAFTHAPVSADLRDKARNSGCDIVHIPLFLCGVVPAYHVEELKGKTLNFTGKILADIFLGKIKQWNDAALKEVNPGVKLPAKAITVVHREDSSGTTQLFTEYLAAVSPAWKEQVGPPADKVKWPVGVAAARNQGVATEIRKLDGSIGYVDRLYTSLLDIKLDYGVVQNRDKTAFVRAEPANLTAAARAVLREIPDDLTFDAIDKSGKESYPITGVVFAVCADKQPDATRKLVVDFLHWATHEGQADVASGFAPLPKELAERIDHRLDAIHAAN
jgi:phosphate ABC transporter phosphate-binding protein